MIIRRATEEDTNLIRNFYNLYWGSLHPLINVKQFWDYYFVDGKFLNFILAIQENTEDISSCCGYIPSNSSLSPDVWTTLWLSKKNSEGMPGLQIVNYLATQMNFTSLSANNVRKKTLGLYNYIGFDTARMRHFYRLAEKSDYQIAIIQNKVILPVTESNYYLKEFKNPQTLRMNFSCEKYYDMSPYKDYEYINKRYYNFPFYKYHVYGVYNCDECISLVVLREVLVNSVTVLRVVDYIGDQYNLGELGSEIQRLMSNFDCEYIDFYCYGFDEETLNLAGFVERRIDDVNIIPNYLEPYSAKNIEYYFFSNKIKGFTLCKADGDQDKLNIDLQN